MKSRRFDKKLIAPCGMNCGVCRAHLREKDPCRGCHDAQQNKPRTRAQCRLRLCRKRKGGFCFSCAEFPCERLKRLDERYRRRYGMSEIENLEQIKAQGIRKFLEAQRRRWISRKGVLCVHDRKHYGPCPE